MLGYWPNFSSSLSSSAKTSVLSAGQMLINVFVRLCLRVVVFKMSGVSELMSVSTPFYHFLDGRT